MADVRVQPMDTNNIFIVRVWEDGEPLDYEYGNYAHALDQYDSEDHTTILEYSKDCYYLVDTK